jgi:hypothetical protein
MVRPDKPTWLLAGLLVFALLVRGGVLFAMRGNLQQDPDAYREIAENLLRHGEFALGKGEPEGGRQPFYPTAYRPPLYPIVLSNLPTANGQQISLAKVAALHLLLGVATVWLTWLTARLLLAGHIGPEGRQEIAPTVRSGIDDQTTASRRSGGPTHGAAASGVGPSGLLKLIYAATTPTLRSGLLHFGPPGLRLAPLLAGLIVACDPILLNQQTLAMTETLAAFLAILSLWCLARFDAQRSWFNAALAGGAIGLAVLCRPTFLPWLGLVAVGMLFTKRSRSKVQGPRSWFGAVGWRVANFAALVMVSAAVISPWAIRNYRVFGKPIVTTTHGGYTLFLGNNDRFYDHLLTNRSELPWSADDLPSGSNAYFRNRTANEKNWGVANVPELRLAFEPAFDEICYSMSRKAINKSPMAFARACLYRVGQLWSPLPHKLTADESTSRLLLRYATCAWYSSVFALAAVGIWRLRWMLLQPPWVWGLLLCLSFTAVHTFYWTNLRMRAPLMPFVALVAAAAALTQSRPPRELSE